MKQHTNTQNQAEEIVQKAALAHAFLKKEEIAAVAPKNTGHKNGFGSE